MCIFNGSFTEAEPVRAYAAASHMEERRQKEHIWLVLSFYKSIDNSPGERNDTGGHKPTVLLGGKIMTLPALISASAILFLQTEWL